VAFLCVNSSLQHFTIDAPNISVPPVTFSIWLNTTAFVSTDTALFHWRGSINTGLILRYVSAKWNLRYYVADGSQWTIDTGHVLSTGVWQHACVAITSSQGRVYLDGVVFTNNASHSSANINDVGYIGRDPFPSSTTFNGALAEPAIWNVALSDAECVALAKRVSPLALTNRLPNLVMYRDLIRDVSRGTGPAMTPINGPAASSHLPLIWPQSRGRIGYPPANFPAPYRPATRAASASPVWQGSAESTGASAGILSPIGEVSS
jgi:hypothetical protein